MEHIESLPDDPLYLLAALVDAETQMAHYATEAMRRLAYLLDRKAATGIWSIAELEAAQARVDLLNQFAPGRVWLDLPRRNP